MKEGLTMIESQIRELLQTISIQTRKSYSDQLRELGLYIGQQLALNHLWEQDGITQSELKEKIGSEASTVSNMLKKLEQDNIIVRRREDKDSRIFRVYLTDKGRELKGPIEDIWSKHEEQLLKGILPEELLLLRRILEQMSNNLSEE